MMEQKTGPSATLGFFHSEQEYNGPALHTLRLLQIGIFTTTGDHPDTDHRKSYILFSSIGNFEQMNKYALNTSNVICAVLKPNFETKNWHIPIVTLRCCVPVHAKDPNHTKVPTTSAVVRQVFQIFPHFYDYTINQCNSSLQIRQNCQVHQVTPHTK